MYFLAQSICELESLNPVWNLVGFIVKTIWIGVPLLLIVYGMIDLGKAVIASKEDEVKKATKLFTKRFLYAIAVFLVVWIVKTVFDLAGNIAGDQFDYDGTSWSRCWCKISEGPENCNNG